MSIKSARERTGISRYLSMSKLLLLLLPLRLRLRNVHVLIGPFNYVNEGGGFAACHSSALPSCDCLAATTNFPISTPSGTINYPSFKCDSSIYPELAILTRHNLQDGHFIIPGLPSHLPSTRSRPLPPCLP